MKQSNDELQNEIKLVSLQNSALQGKIGDFDKQTQDLQNQFGAISTLVTSIQSSEEELKNSLQDVIDKSNNDNSGEIKNFIVKVQTLQQEMENHQNSIIKRMDAVETGLKQSPTFGIFSYIDIEEHSLFINTVETAVEQENTYAKINDYLSKNLPVELNKTIKAHPSLTKTYLKNVRKE